MLFRGFILLRYKLYLIERFEDMLGPADLFAFLEQKKSTRVGVVFAQRVLNPSRWCVAVVLPVRLTPARIQRMARMHQTVLVVYVDCGLKKHLSMVYINTTPHVTH